MRETKRTVLLSSLPCKLTIGHLPDSFWMLDAGADPTILGQSLSSFGYIKMLGKMVTLPVLKIASIATYHLC